MEKMLRPFAINGREKNDGFNSRYSALEEKIPAIPGDVISEETIADITSGNRKKGDSLHLLVIDVHKALNRVQADLSGEEIDGARTYLLGEWDRQMVRAFMKGLNSTKPLKFDHPGLGTTATRAGEKLVIQNDIGETDAHVIVINVTAKYVSMTYTDVHISRLRFFQSLFPGYGVSWSEITSKSREDLFEDDRFYMTVASFSAASDEEKGEFLCYLGSKIVFLIDWNKARKKIRLFLKNTDIIEILRWAALEEYGHRGFLELGGEEIIFEGLELASNIPMRYGEPLHLSLGRERTADYFRWALMTAAKRLLEDRPRQFIRDEMKAGLLRQFHSVRKDLLDMCCEHASFVVETAVALQQSIIHIGYKPDERVHVTNAIRSKRWETRADEIVNRVRAITKKVKNSRFYSELITLSDDAIDYLEESASICALDPPLIMNREILDEMIIMAEIVVKGTQEFLKTLYASRYIHRECNYQEMQDFLYSVDEVVRLEEECDKAHRSVQTMIITRSSDYREAVTASEISRGMEESMNSLMKAAFLTRDTILENLIS
ncbi:MAG: DUF47 family protein [Methanomicrobiaceae archaeon]|nr:DUF47 family protein [Methanomicrobiaceae archaeon]